jgi:hypothetical protein
VGCPALPIVPRSSVAELFFTNRILTARNNSFAFATGNRQVLPLVSFGARRWIYFTTRTLSGSNWLARFRRRNPPQLARRRPEMPLSDLLHQLRFDG